MICARRTTSALLETVRTWNRLANVFFLAAIASETKIWLACAIRLHRRPFKMAPPIEPQPINPIFCLSFISKAVLQKQRFQVEANWPLLQSPIQNQHSCPLKDNASHMLETLAATDPVKYAKT